MGIRSSGSAAVDAMDRIRISGNVIPESWYKEILRDNGKPYLLAIILLSEIVYWYRPTEERDESSGCVIGLKKRFHGDILQKSYQDLATKYGESRRTVKMAFDRLEELGLIRRIFRDIELKNGTKLPNVMYVEIFPERIEEISHYDIDESTSGPSVQKLESYVSDDPGFEIKESSQSADSSGFEEGHTKFCTTSHKIMYDLPQNNESYHTKKVGDIPQNNEPYPTQDRMTYTENTTKTTDIDYPSIDQSDCKDIQGTDQMDQIDSLALEARQYQEYIYERLNYRWHLDNDPYPENEKYAQLVDLVCDEVCANKKTSFVNRSEMPHEVVKSRFLKLDESHIEYVRECLNKNPNHGGIEDMRKYLITCLYNSPVTIEQYYQQDFNHDKYGGR